MGLAQVGSQVIVEGGGFIVHSAEVSEEECGFTTTSSRQSPTPSAVSSTKRGKTVFRSAKPSTGPASSVRAKGLPVRRERRSCLV